MIIVIFVELYINCDSNLYLIHIYQGEIENHIDIIRSYFNHFLLCYICFGLFLS